MRKGWDKDMEQEKLYVIEEKTYEAHIDEEVHLYGLLHLPGRSRTAGTWRT